MILLLSGPLSLRAAEISSECWNKYKDRPKKVLSDQLYQSGTSAEKLDIYHPPQGLPPFPTVVLIHGGCFQYGSKTAEDTEEYITRLTGAGYAVVSLDYSLVREGKDLFPTAIEDVQDAVRWVRANGTKYGLKTQPLTAFGYSAGATLAAHLGTRMVGGSARRLDGRPVSDPILSRRVDAVIDFFGRMDFLKSRPAEAHDNGLDCGETFVGKKRTESTKGIFARADVISTVSPMSAKFLIVHGTKDSAVSIEHSEMLYEKLQEVDKTGKRGDRRYRVEGGDHGLDKPGEATQAWLQVCGFLDHIHGKEKTKEQTLESAGVVR